MKARIQVGLRDERAEQQSRGGSRREQMAGREKAAVIKPSFIDELQTDTRVFTGLNKVQLVCQVWGKARLTAAAAAAPDLAGVFQEVGHHKCTLMTLIRSHTHRHTHTAARLDNYSSCLWAVLTLSLSTLLHLCSRFLTEFYLSLPLFFLVFESNSEWHRHCQENNSSGLPLALFFSYSSFF